MTLARAWLNRAHLELDRGRPELALPYLIWGDQELRQMEPPQSKPGLTADFVRVYARVGWWDLALRRKARVPGLESIEADDLLPTGLPDDCRRIRDRLAASEAGAAIRDAGERWRQRVPALAEWEETCTRPRG